MQYLCLPGHLCDEDEMKYSDRIRLTNREIVELMLTEYLIIDKDCTEYLLEDNRLITLVNGELFIQIPMLKKYD